MAKKKKVAKKAVKKVAKKVAKKVTAKKVVKKAAKKTASKKKKKKTKAPKVSVLAPQEISAEMITHIKRWQKLRKQYEETAVVDYNIRNTYEVKAAIKHKLFGWGLVISKRDNFIEVVFESAVKTLISDYTG